ncbi:uncharacterized protein LOC123510277 isoform X2 [Portunus trituberculatus]|uniref:uncharacterized protein LOC123510277 isoform X2 n=1 Tax=Portunus trituberculatus TaxID=210409 RepID=UPI001E1CE1A7|nr:uncharacterized protein LOC123510277 isoform X2 [Portunus trituberculatus]
MGGGRRCQGTTSCRVFLLAAVVLCCVGLGFGNEKGFPFSVKNTKGKHHYHRRKDEAGGILTSGEIPEEEVVGGGGGGGGRRGSWLRPRSDLRPPPLVYNALERSSLGHSEGDGTQPAGDVSSVPSSGAQNVHLSRSTDEGTAGGAGGADSPYVAANHLPSVATRGEPWLRPARRRAGARRSSSSSSSSSFFSRLMAWLPWPLGEASWFSGGSHSRADSRKSHFRVIHQPAGNELSPNQQSFNTKQFSFPQPFSPQSFGPQSFSPQSFSPQSFSPQSFAAPPFLAPPFGGPPFSPFQSFPQPPQTESHGSPPRTVGPQVADVLQVSPDTPADTDHVPSFAAKVFVVREAPKDYYPPGYTPADSHEHHSVEVPRTKFFCEEQRYLPGLYADTQLGCKVFHMCLPAAVGNTMTSFLCPNMTLFDQSILQCNWWYYVRCEDSHLNYDANLPLALSYRKVNAAQLPLTAIQDYNSLSLLDISARTARKLDGGAEGGAVGRMGLADVEEEEMEDDSVATTETVGRDFDGEMGTGEQETGGKDDEEQEVIIEEEIMTSDTEEGKSEAVRGDNEKKTGDGEQRDDEEEETKSEEQDMLRSGNKEDERKNERETDGKDSEEEEGKNRKDEKSRSDDGEQETDNEEEKTVIDEDKVQDRVKRFLPYKIYNVERDERLLNDRKVEEVREYWEREEIKGDTGLLSRNKRHEHNLDSVLVSRLRIRDLPPYS